MWYKGVYGQTNGSLYLPSQLRINTYFIASIFSNFQNTYLSFHSHLVLFYPSLLLDRSYGVMLNLFLHIFGMEIKNNTITSLIFICEGFLIFNKKFAKISIFCFDY